MTRSSWTISALLLTAVTVAAVLPTRASDPSLTTEELLEQERVRQAVETAFELFEQPATGDQRNENTVLAAQQLVALGDDAVPYLIIELDQTHPLTFTFCAYALGLLNHPDAEAPLRAALAAANQESGQFALARKAWAGYALGLMGKADVINLLSDDHHLAGRVSIHSGASVLEMVALFSGAAAIPELYSQLKAFKKSETLSRERMFTIKALRRIPAPTHVAALLETIEGSNSAIRREAARSMGPVMTPESEAALLEMMQTDVDPHVRFAAATALEKSLPARYLGAFIESLATERSPYVRGSLYRMIARIGGRSTFKVLKSQWGQRDPIDREFLIQALPLAGAKDKALVEALGIALSDSDTKIAALTVRVLGQVGSDRAIDLIVPQIDSSRWPVAQTTIRLVARLGLEQAIPPLLDRLFGVEMANVVTDPHQRERVYALGRALVRLGYTGHLEQLRKELRRQYEGGMVVFLRETLAKTETMQSNGIDEDAWIETMKSDDEEQRRLAYTSLARHGTGKGAAAMTRMFGRVTIAEGAEILRAIGDIDSEESRTLIERVLSSEAFDPVGRAPARAMAAWSARKLGGQRMIDLLIDSADRRSGQDPFTLFYLAVLAGEDALPVIARHRIPRMRYLKWTRALELDYLDWISRHLEAGREISLLDVAPERIDLITPPND